MSSNTGAAPNGQEQDQQLRAQVELLRGESEEQQGVADVVHHTEHQPQTIPSPQEVLSNGFDPAAAAARDVKRALSRPQAEQQYIHPDLRGQEDVQAHAPAANMASAQPQSEALQHEPPHHDTTVHQQQQPPPQEQPQHQPQPQPHPHQQQQPLPDQHMHVQADQHMQHQQQPRQPSDPTNLHATAGPNIAPAPPAQNAEGMQRWHDGRSRPNRELSQTKRAAQNRAAQRAFRARKETMIKRLEQENEDFRKMESTYRQGRVDLYRMRQYALHLQSRLYDLTGEMPQPPPGLDMTQPEEPPRPMTPEYIRNAKGLEAVARAVAGLEAASGTASPKSEDQEMKDEPGPAAPSQEQLTAQASEA